ncbi:hypothetical protein [Nocardia fluminea]|uniref:hypothetical protein n=1 Tax=Nocardia fluminea TaxID=134984 RepID=UPI003D0D7F1B
MTAPKIAAGSDPVSAVRPKRKNTQVANMMVVLVRSMLGVLVVRLRELVIVQEFTDAAVIKPLLIDQD